MTGDPGTSTHPGHRVSRDEPELRILLIEDSERIRTRLVELLDEPGSMRVVASAATQDDAIACIDGETFDVLLVDVELRQGSGIAAIRHARRTYAAGRQPLIIVLTNYALPAVRSRCMEAGADHFLDKMRQFQEVKALIVANSANRG